MTVGVNRDASRLFDAVLSVTKARKSQIDFGISTGKMRGVSNFPVGLCLGQKKVSAEVWGSDR